MKRIIALLFVMVSLSLFGRPALAGPMLNNFLIPENTLTDSDAEYISSAGESPGSTSVLSRGAVLTSILSFNNLNGLQVGSLVAGLKLPVGYQLTAVANIKVTDMSLVGTTTIGGKSVNLYDFKFGPTSPGAAMISLYESAAGNFTRNGPIATAVANAESGTLVATFGLSGANDFWIANDAPSNLGVFSSFTTALQGTAFHFGISMLTNPGGLNLSPGAQPLTFDTTVKTGGGNGGSPTGSTTYPGTNNYDLIGTGQVFGTKGQGTNFQAYTSTQVNFASPVPEPSSCLLLGIGGVTLAFFRKRRKKADVGN